MESEAFDSTDWDEIVERLGGAETLSASAREHGALTRVRAVRSATDLLRLAFMYGPGGFSLRTLAATAHAEGLCQLSDVALLKRLSRANAWLSQLCSRMLEGGTAPASDGDEKKRLIRIVDSSRLEGPGDRAWRLHLSFDPAAGRIADACITGLDKGERLDRLPPQAGAIYLADRGYPQPDGLRRLIEAGADALVRVTWNSLRLRDDKDQPLDWANLFAAARTQGGLDMKVFVCKSRGKFEPLRMRLVILPKPAEAAARARACAVEANRRGQRRNINPLTLEGADHLVLITSLGPKAFTKETLAALYRLRWQIELAFKRLKSLLRIDRLPAKSEALASTWLHAHLLYALIIDAALVESGDFPP